MREFDLIIPKNLGDALDALSSSGPEAQPLAGGTDMIVNVRARVVQPQVLVSLAQVTELSEVQREDGQLRVGAGVNVAAFLKDPTLVEGASIVSKAASKFANPMIRNLATVGGNVASASPAADLAPPLLALEASVELVGREGKRILPLADFFVGPRKTARRADELITAFRWHIPDDHSSNAFYKLGMREADAISIVSVAVMLEIDAGTCTSARIALGAVAPRPMRAMKAESVLNGEPISDSTIAEAARLASEECTPIDDLRGSAAYRRRMVRVYVERMLKQAWRQAA